MNKLIILFLVISSSVFCCEITLKTSDPDDIIRDNNSLGLGWAQIIINSDLSAKSYFRMVNTIYSHGVFNIILTKNDKSIRLPLTSLIDDLSVVVQNAGKSNLKKINDGSYYLSISSIQSNKNGKYTRVTWEISDIKTINQRKNIDFLCREVNESKNEKIGIIFLLNQEINMSHIFDIIYEIQGKINKNIIGVNFGIEQ